jgi:hypothetical protein
MEMQLQDSPHWPQMLVLAAAMGQARRREELAEAAEIARRIRDLGQMRTQEVQHV